MSPREALLAAVVTLVASVVAADMEEAARKEQDRRAGVKHEGVRTIGQDDVRTATAPPRSTARPRGTAPPPQAMIRNLPPGAVPTEVPTATPRPTLTRDQREGQAEMRRKDLERYDARIRAAEQEVETLKSYGNVDMYEWVEKDGHATKWYPNRDRMKRAEERVQEAKRDKQLYLDSLKPF